MRSHWQLVPIMAALLIVGTSGCKDPVSSDDLGYGLAGDINQPISQIGNSFSVGLLSVGSNQYDLHAALLVTKNDNGVATFHINADIPTSTTVQNLIALFPGSVIGGDGRFTMDLKLKITSDGMQDYFNSDGKARLLVKYDANVGDTYLLKNSNGTTITRTVTQKSTTDDFPYGLFLIKTITVEQDSKIPGVSKITMKYNHRFGLVFVDVLMEDGTHLTSYLYTQNS